jgi:hypothetical protein
MKSQLLEILEKFYLRLRVIVRVDCQQLWCQADHHVPLVLQLQEVGAKMAHLLNLPRVIRHAIMAVLPVKIVQQVVHLIQSRDFITD